VNETFLQKLNAVYDGHFLGAEAVIQRVQKGRCPTDAPITELDLAIDKATGITDQNHVDEIEASIAIGKHLAITARSSILDVGSGLGGTARVLAHLYGSRAVGVELTEKRHQNSLQLTQLVGLDHLVKLVQADFSCWDARGALFDAVLMVDSICHFAERSATIRKCLSLCAQGGTVLIRDVRLDRKPVSRGEQRALAELEDHWNVAGWEPWHKSIDQLGLLRDEKDLSPSMRRHFTRLLAIPADRQVHPPSALEKNAWRRSVMLIDAGILSYRQWCLAPS
jgi:SAM-dependent methyltransferase